MLEAADRIARWDARVVLVAYDERSLLEAKLLHDLELPFPLLLDAGQQVYRRWGLGRTTLARSVLSPRLTWRYLRLLLRGERFLGFAPDMLQLGGDFVVDPAGRVAFAHAMRDNGDRAPAGAILAALRHAASTP